MKKSLDFNRNNSDGSGFDMVWSFEVDSMVQQAANQRVIALGDVNGNGMNELLFGVTPIDEGDPNLFVFEASDGALPATPTAGLITPRPKHEFLNADSTVNRTFLHWMWEEPWVISDIDGDGQNEFVGTGSGVMVMEFSGDWSDPNAPDDVNFEFVDPGPDETVMFGAPGILPEKFATALTAGDLDGDGDKDLVAMFPGWRHFGNDNETFEYKERPLRVFETTGEDSYNLTAQMTLPTSKATSRTPAWTGFTPYGWMGANRGVVAMDLDNDGRDEIFHTNVGGFAGVGGSLWVIDFNGNNTADLDSTDIHLLVEFADFLPEGTNSATHGLAVGDLDGDGNVEFYVADLDARRVWQVEYQGGDITDPASYTTKEIMHFEDGTQPKTLKIGQDMDNDGRMELIVQGPPGNSGGNIIVLEHAKPTAVEESPQGVPAKFDLAQNYPNPFNPSTTIKYTVARKSHVKLTIYNMLGEVVVRLVDKVEPQGSHVVVWNGRDHRGKPVFTGVYFYTLEAGNFKQTRKMLILK